MAVVVLSGGGLVAPSAGGPAQGEGEPGSSDFAAALTRAEGISIRTLATAIGLRPLDDCRHRAEVSPALVRPIEILVMCACSTVVAFKSGRALRRRPG